MELLSELLKEDDRLIRSMTGYGRGEYTSFSRRFTVEIKSVNHRYGEISIKLPRVINPLEEKVKSVLNKRISRGKVDVYISLESFSKKDITVCVNTALCDSYVDALNAMKSGYGLKDDITLTLLSRVPDVITVEKNIGGDEHLTEMWETLEMALLTALDGFIAMREREGAVIAADLAEKTKLVTELTKMIIVRAPLVADEYEKKLRAKLEEALSGSSFEPDEARIIQEITVFADKSCIDEELVRLDSHFSQFSEILKNGGAVGKKLDFLIQEINREINTIGSKSNDIEITRIVVELKSELEKIREQVQNIE